MTRVWIRWAALVHFLALVGFVPTATANPTVFEPAGDPAVGFNLISWNTSATSTAWQNAVQAVYDNGFREVSISPVRLVDVSTGNITQSFYPTLTAIDAGVVRAKQLGMRVTLNPFVELSGGQWRANFAPLPGSTTANNFWPQYESYLDAVAAIAQNRGVDAVTVGTEMKGLDSFYNISDFDPVAPGNQFSPSQAQLDQQETYWDTVIDSVQSIYDGQIGYAANWDNFNATRVTNNLWSHEHIDYIGIDSYFRFESQPYQIPTSESDPVQTYPDEDFIQLVANEWNERLDNQIMPFAASQGKPVVFTEQGYNHHNGVSRNPQDEDGAVDTAEQIMAFQGLLRAMDGRQDDLLAMHIWQWEMAGSQGSTWNINPLASANQPDNRPLAQWLSGFVRNLLPGDFNRDGVVDAADYVVWRKTDGGAGGFSAWAERFGQTSGGGATSNSAPEPGVFWLILTAMSAALGYRRRMS
jgi:hypothetical protein